MLRAKFLRFLLAGAVNTGLTYVVYALLSLWISYQSAYLIAYISGIAVSYFLNTLFVFHHSLSVRKFFQFPVVYLAQYFTGAALLYLLVEVLGVDPLISPLFVIAATVPVTFLFSKLILTDKTRSASTYT